MQSVSSQPFRRIPLDCMFRNAVQILTVSCPFGAYISIRLWRRPITLRTDTARQRLHSTLIMPSAFLNPINWVPQFGQYQENGYQVRIFESDQLGAAVRAVPGEWIPGVFALIHF